MIIMISDVINLRNACDFLFVSVSLFTAVTYLREIFVHDPHVTFVRGEPDPYYLVYSHKVALILHYRKGM